MTFWETVNAHPFISLLIFYFVCETICSVTKSFSRRDKDDY